MLTNKGGLPVRTIKLGLSNDFVEGTVGGDGDAFESFKSTLKAHHTNRKAINGVRDSGDSGDGGCKEEHHAHESEEDGLHLDRS